MTMISQCRGEDIKAISHFGESFMGRFLDLGCFDPAIGGSITYLLAQRGWEGVWVEAGHAAMGDVIKLARTFDGRVSVVHGAVGTKHGLVPLWDCGGYSTCSAVIKDIGAERGGAYKLLVPAFTPDDIVEAFPGAFDVVSIDVEGLSLDVMRAFPWDAVKCRFAVIEAFDGERFGNEPKVVREFMESVGFSFVEQNVENVVMAR